MCNSVPSSFLLYSKFCFIIVLCCKFFKSNKEGSDLLIKVALESTYSRRYKWMHHRQCFNWVSWNQYQSKSFDQSQQIVKWANHDAKQINALGFKHRKNNNSCKQVSNVFALMSHWLTMWRLLIDLSRIDFFCMKYCLNVRCWNLKQYPDVVHY